MGIPDHLTCSWETSMQVRKQQLELDMEQQSGSKYGKEYVKSVYCHPAYFNLYPVYFMWNAKLDEAHAGIKIAGENINNLRYSDEEELKSLWCKWEESEKVRLKLNIQKTKIMASGPITSWEIDRETVETVSDFILGGSKITADGDCSHDIKRRLLLGRKVMTNIDSIF